MNLCQAPSILEQILGCPLDELPASLRDEAAGISLECTSLEGEAREAHILHILQRLNETSLHRNEEENRRAFEQGWSENLNAALKSGITEQALTPGYVRPHGTIRWQSGFAVPEDPFLAHKLLRLSVQWSFHRYLEDARTAYEFGCGSCQYLHLLSRLRPDLDLFGLDFTQSAVSVARQMAEHGARVEGRLFDMTRPDRGFKLAEGSAVYTVGALEQIGSRFGDFLEYLIDQKPAVVIHHEPIVEFYDPDKLSDYLAILWHRRRDYLNGYWPALQHAAREGRIEILEARRPGFGDPYHESTPVIVWRPSGPARTGQTCPA